MDQISIFDLTMSTIGIKNRIRLIELFAGYGSQAMALDEIGADYEHHKVIEFDKFAIQSYNAVHCTHFPQTDIRETHGQDLEIAETDRYTYLMTYSFPCTDLSVAGKMAGMKKGSRTRSGLLWEVERILTEIKTTGGELPQILLMENVPQVVAKANIKDFHSWQQHLENLGYTNYVQILNSKDYGVAQNRERCFMFSFLGDYNYRFPEPIPLNHTIKDYLEDQVDEKYYINTERAEKLIIKLLENGQLQENEKLTKLQKIEKIGHLGTGGQKGRVYSETGVCPSESASQYKDPIKILEVKQLGNIMPTNTRDNPNQGRVYSTDGLCPTLNCMGSGNREPMIVAMRGRNLEDPISKTTGGPTEQRLEPNTKGVCNTLTSVQKDNLVLENYIDLYNQKMRSDKCSGTLTTNYGTQFHCGSMGVLEKILIWRIRKLTERECGRLMGVPEKYIDNISKTVSRSQAYKQFGNSIVVQVMIAMFSNLHIQNCPTWDEIKDRYI